MEPKRDMDALVNIDADPEEVFAALFAIDLDGDSGPDDDD